MKVLSHKNAIKSPYFGLARIEESIEIEESYLGRIDQNWNRKSLVSRNRNRTILESTQHYYFESQNSIKIEISTRKFVSNFNFEGTV